MKAINSFEILELDINQDIVLINVQIMENIAIAVNAIIFVNLIIGTKGFSSNSFIVRYGLVVDKILTGKEYGRLWTASWVHAHWSHLLFNTLMLFCIGFGVNWQIGVADFLFLFLMSQLGGNLIALFTYRDDRSGQYDAVGAAGGVSGLLFGSIALFPSLTMVVPIVGYALPVWPLAIFFLSVSIFALKPYSGTMIHDAHLGGAIVGLLLTPLIAPDILQNTLWMAIGILTPTVVLFYALVKAPENVITKTFSLPNDTPGSWEGTESVTDPAHHALDYLSLEDEMNALLDKINQHGYQNLSHYELERLQSISSRKKAV